MKLDAKVYQSKKTRIWGIPDDDTLKEVLKKNPEGVFIDGILGAQEIIQSDNLFNLIQYNKEIRKEIMLSENNYETFLDTQFSDWRNFKTKKIKDNIFFYSDSNLIYSIRINLLNFVDNRSYEFVFSFIFSIHSFFCSRLAPSP